MAMQRNVMQTFGRLLATMSLVCVVTARTRTQTPATKAPSGAARSDEGVSAGLSHSRHFSDEAGAGERPDSLPCGQHGQGRRRVVLYDANGKTSRSAEQVEEKELPRPVFDADSFASARHLCQRDEGDARRQRGISPHRARHPRTAMVAKPDGTVISFE